MYLIENNSNTPCQFVHGQLLANPENDCPKRHQFFVLAENQGFKMSFCNHWKKLDAPTEFFLHWHFCKPNPPSYRKLSSLILTCWWRICKLSTSETHMVLTILHQGRWKWSISRMSFGETWYRSKWKVWNAPSLF